jgi:hypothetical protein
VPDFVTIPTEAESVTVSPEFASDHVPVFAAVWPSFTVTVALFLAITGAALFETVSVPVPSAKSPEAAVFVARAVKPLDPAGVAAVVVIVKVEVAVFWPLPKETVEGLKDALAPAGRVVVTESEALNVPFTLVKRETVMGYVTLPAVPAARLPTWAPTDREPTRLTRKISCSSETTVPLP